MRVALATVFALVCLLFVLTYFAVSKRVKTVHATQTTIVPNRPVESGDILIYCNQGEQAVIERDGENSLIVGCK